MFRSEQDWSKNGQQRSKAFQRPNSVTDTIGRIPILTWSRPDEQSHIRNLNLDLRALGEHTIAESLIEDQIGPDMSASGK